MDVELNVRMPFFLYNLRKLWFTKQKREAFTKEKKDYKSNQFWFYKTNRLSTLLYADLGRLQTTPDDSVCSRFRVNPDDSGRLRTTSKDSERLRTTPDNSNSELTERLRTISNGFGRIRAIPGDSKRLRIQLYPSLVWSVSKKLWLDLFLLLAAAFLSNQGLLARLYFILFF